MRHSFTSLWPQSQRTSLDSVVYFVLLIVFWVASPLLMAALVVLAMRAIF